MFLFSQIRYWSARLGLLVLIPGLAWSQGTYTSNFPLTENPISESGKWINGGVAGLRWTNIRTTPGRALGTQSGTDAGKARYADSTAILAGTWGPNQTVQATVFVANASGASGVFEEVELRLRTNITPNSITGYEIAASVHLTDFYISVARWNGPLAKWTSIGGSVPHPCVNGDVLKATMIGSTITVYLNGVQMLQVTDTTYKNGSPGIGLFLQGASGLNANYGFSSFTATDNEVPATSQSQVLPQKGR
jgi:hypothetical protein